ncbi:MAG: tetratricopeptide repeat protein [Firmicutes bacterium]|nr:tetratricopeptide repeat protein [Bacillota bacterium]
MLNFRIIFRTRLTALLAFLAIFTGIAYAADKAEIFYNKGQKSFKNGKYSEALTFYKKAAEANPDMKQAWLEQGNTLIVLGQYDKALDALYIALDIDSNYKKAFVAVGECYLKKGDYKNATFKLNEAANKFPQDADIFFLLGKACEGAGEYEKAAAIYKQAVKINPDKYEHLNESIKKLESPDVAGAPFNQGGTPIPDELHDASPAATSTAASAPVETSAPSSPAPENASPSPIASQTATAALAPSAKNTLWIPTDDDEALPEKNSSADFNKITVTTIIALVVFILGIIIVIKVSANRKKRAEEKIRSVKHPESDFTGDTIAAKSTTFLNEPDFDTSESDDFAGKIGGDQHRKETVPFRKTSGGYSKITQEERGRRPASDNQDYFNQLRDKTALEAMSDSASGETRIQDVTEYSGKTTVNPKVDGMSGENERIRYCSCGFNNKPGSKFCTRCGLTVKPEMPAGGDESSDDTFSAPPQVKPFKRGLTVFMTPVVCSCGKIVRDGSALCPRCGKGLR